MNYPKFKEWIKLREAGEGDTARIAQQIATQMAPAKGPQVQAAIKNAMNLQSGRMKNKSLTDILNAQNVANAAVNTANKNSLQQQQQQQQQQNNVRPV